MKNGRVEIKVKPQYFDDFTKCVDALNSFFQSGYKTKNFPMIDEEDDVEPVILHILKWMDLINPTWIDNSEKVEDAVDTLRKISDDLEDKDDDEVDDSIQDLLNEYIAFKMLQLMADHKSEVEKLFQGIYSIELFKNPSKYIDALDMFGKPMRFPELGCIVDHLGGAEGYKLFDEAGYVSGVFHNEYIDVPGTLKQEAECNRLKERIDRPDIEIVIDERTTTDDEENVNESFMYVERAEINFFEETNPPHIRYHEDSKKWQISKQFTAAITRLLAGLKTCDTVDDVEEFLNTNANKILPDDYTCMVLPCILARVFANPKKFKNRVFDEKALKKYTDSYDSIIKQNKGAKSFKDYDLFTVFKTDKEGTLQFLEDFLTLRLASDPNAYIQNHELMILFNIFDSRIYFDILYNVMPKSVQENEWKNEDNFVKTIRARLNANSNKSNVYDDATKKPDETTGIKNMEEVNEYVLRRLKRYGDITLEDTRLCDDILSMVKMELGTLENRLYNEGVSQMEHYQFIQELKMPRAAVNGDLPDYMRTRLEIDKDDNGNKNDEPEVEDVDLPDDIPTNPIDELADSIETRANVFGQDGKDLDDAFGADADIKPIDPKKPHHQGQVVYNITYNNSFNRNDLSQNKTVRTNSHDIKNSNIKGSLNTPSNSNNNGTPSADTSEKTDTKTSGDNNAFSTGKTVQEVFAMLYSKEPLFVEDVRPDKPKSDLLTFAMDVDRKTLAGQQEAKKALNKGIGTAKKIVQPIQRTRDWLMKTVDNLVKRDEDEVKRNLIENPSFRTAIFKASRVALKLGLVATAWAINPYIGLITAGGLALREVDKNRLRKEVQDEYVTEIKIIDERIKSLDEHSYGISQKQRNANLQEKERLMRLRNKMVKQAASVSKSPLAFTRSKDFT